MISTESVTPGHPDKIADRISDAIVDAVLELDPYGRVACETFVTPNKVIIGGEISSKYKIDLAAIAAKEIKEIGYNSKYKFNDNVKVEVLVTNQSSDIFQGVNSGGAGDQGNMFGFAIKGDNFLPEPLNIVHKLAKDLYELRDTLKYLGPDGKTQITFSDKLESVTISVQHDENISINSLREDVKKHLLEDYTCPIYINPTGRFVIGGPEADAGLTGRKIIIDSYGPFCKHGGGAFSGKDPTKVDRSGAYAARWIAKNIVAANLAEICEVQLSYIIGVEEPISLNIDTFGTGDNKYVTELVKKHFDLRPMSIIERLDLRKPIYKKLTSYGHFGRNDVSWENLDMVSTLK